MKSLAKTLAGPHRSIYKHLYSTSASDKKGGKMSRELCDIQTDDEIANEVREIGFTRKCKVQR